MSVATVTVHADGSKASVPITIGRAAGRFALVNYAIDRTRIAADVAHGIDTYVLQPDANGLAAAKQIKAASPTALCLAYQDAYMTVSGQPGITSIIDYATADLHESWFLHSASPIAKANRIESNAPWLLNVADPGLQAAAVQHVLATLKSGPFDGIYLDSLDPTLKWALAPAKVHSVEFSGDGTASGDSAWQTALLASSTAIAQAVRAQRKLCYANVGGAAPYPAWWGRCLQVFDGVEEEFFTDAGSTAAQSDAQRAAAGKWALNSQLAQLQACETVGKPCLVHAHYSTRAQVVYALAAMLLVAGGECAWCVNGPDPASNNLWFPELDVAKQYVAPLGPYVLSAGVYSRRFSVAPGSGLTGLVTVDVNALTGTVG